MATQLGRIAALSQRVRAEVSPLQRQVSRVAQLIALVAVVAGVAFLLLGVAVAGLSISDSVTFAIGLLVANVPEGLLPTITLALAVGVRRMARRRALIKRLTAVETLGSTEVICTDKTGTLTEGRMIARVAWADGQELAVRPDRAGRARREPFRALLRTAVRCNNASLQPGPGGGFRRSGDPSESALLAFAAALGEDVAGAQAERELRRRRLYHFDARVKRMTTADDEPGGDGFHHAKGAPLELLERCTAVRGADGDRPLEATGRERVRAAFARYAAQGLRVLGFAERRIGPGGPAEERESAEAELTFLGLIALEDPPRPDVADAVARCKRAGIRIVVVTGDHGLTASAVARQVGIVGEHPDVRTGAELGAMGTRSSIGCSRRRAT